MRLAPVRLLTCLVCVASAYACGSSEEPASTPPMPSPEPSTSAAPGSSGGPATPGTSGDAGTDAGTPSTEPSSPSVARVTVLAIDGTPMANTSVVFHASDGAPIATLVTNAQGFVERAVSAGEMVTALLRGIVMQGDDTDALTFLGVENGDGLVARQSGLLENTQTVPASAVGIPADTGLLDLRALTRAEPGFNGGCRGGASPSGQTTVPVNVAANPLCLFAGSTQLFARATNNGGVSVYSVKAGAAPNAAVNVEPWTAGVPTSFTVANVPNEGAPLIAAEAWGATNVPGALFPASFVGSLSFSSPGGTQQLPSAPPPSLFSAVERVARFHAPGPVRASSSIIVRGPGATSYTFDFSTAPPIPRNVVATPSAAGRPQLAFSWPANTPAKGISAHLREGTQRWRFIAPPSVRSLTVPALPAALDAWAMKSNTFQTTVVSAYETAALADYRAFRTQAHAWASWGTGRGAGLTYLPTNTTLYVVAGY